MDYSWITEHIALGGGIWREENMAEMARAGFTHIIDKQVEFDERSLAAPHGIEVLWNPIDDDFQAQPPEIVQRGVEFARAVVQDPADRPDTQCAAGLHRPACITLAL